MSPDVDRDVVRERAQQDDEVAQIYQAWLDYYDDADVDAEDDSS